MAYARMIGIREAADLSGYRDKPRIHRDPNDVVARRHRILTVSAVEHEILPDELEDIRVRPAMADPLIAGNADSPATPEERWSGRGASERRGSGIRVEHAEPTLGGAPYLPCVGIDQLVLGIVPEMIVIVAGGKFV